MTTLPRCVTAIVVWAAVSAPAYAQGVADAASIRARLRSASAADVAWAAFEAGTYQIHDAIPELIAVLDSPPPAANRERLYLVAAVLDALIQLRGPRGTLRPTVVPPKILERYYATWPVQALILFGRAGPERDPILLNLLHTASDQEWCAIANLLVVRQVPGFAADALKGLTIALFISVTDRGSEGGIGAGVGGIGGVGGGWRISTRWYGAGMPSSYRRTHL